jgi:hypothetical protein
MEINPVPKVPKLLSCKICDYTTCRQSQLDRHFSTLKHIEATKGLQNTTVICDQVEDNVVQSKYHCAVCNKYYKHHSSLWKHTKTCSGKKVTSDDSDPSEKELIMMLLKQNSELILKLGTTTTTNLNNTNTNSHNNNNNKTFNLQFFLNEECKNALNISEFVSSIKMDLDDLEKTGLLGYAEGISNIINKNLSDLDQTMRPIHCSDVKREVFYVKNDDQWIKENDSKPVLTKAIKQVAHDNIRQISEWRKKYPDCCDPDSTKNDVYLNIVSNAMSGGTSEEQMKNYEKIISNVAKEVVIEKTMIV